MVVVVLVVVLFGLNGVLFWIKVININWLGKVGVQFDIIWNVMVYGIYVCGYKGLVFNIFFNLMVIGINLIVVEIFDVYEIGLKNMLFGGKLVVNFVVYYVKYYNFQVNNLDVVVGVFVICFINVGDILMCGGEFDLIYCLVCDFNILGGFVYIDVYVDQFRVLINGVMIGVVFVGMQFGYVLWWKGLFGGDYWICIGSSIDVIFGV